MFELADRLVGIYKTCDVTKSITINPKRIAAECASSEESTNEDTNPNSSSTKSAPVVTTSSLPLSSRSRGSN